MDDSHTSVGGAAELLTPIEVTDEREQIRLYVPGSSNYGHLATCITVLYRLIHLGYTRIRVIYDPKDPVGKSTWGKLATVVSGLPSEPIAEHTVLGATVFFDEYLEFSKPRWETLGTTSDLSLCVTGACDDTQRLIAKPNFLKVHLHAERLLVLQPCSWRKLKARHAIYSGFDYEFRLDSSEAPFDAEFPDRGYCMGYRFAPLGPKPDAEPADVFSGYGYSAQFVECLRLDLAGLATRAPVKRRLLSDLLTLCAARPELQVCPGYYSPSRHYSANEDAALPLLNLILGISQLNSRYDPGPAPVTLLVMMGPLAASDYVRLLKRLAAEPFTALEHWDPERLRVCWGEDELLEQVCEDLGSGGIVIVPLGAVDSGVFVPRMLFDHVFSLGTLPRFFEGEGTLNLALNLGLPYIHLISIDVLLERAEDKPLYPTLGVDPEPHDLVATCHAGSWLLHTSLERWRTLAGAPSHERPDRLLAEHFHRACFFDDEPLYGYFRALGAFYANADQCKLFHALKLIESLDNDAEDDSGEDSSDESSD